MSRNIFIFVVCGAREHIDTLHFSLQYLKRFSKNEIMVLTDSTRNEIPVEHDRVIDVRTPENFNHHQASIYLKTGIYQFVPSNNNYCYLDTDVIAMSPMVDDIFSEFVLPVRFAPDHCKMDKFSAYAVNCGCQEIWRKDRDLYNAALQKHDRNLQITDPDAIAKAKELQLVFDQLKKSPVKKLTTAARYLLSYPRFRLNSSYYFDRKNRTWQDADKNVVMYEVDVKKIEAETGFKYHRFSQKWLNEAGIDIWQDQCDHLKEYIKEKFQVEVGARKFQHWNGGVFLFNDTSHEFLKTWFDYTMQVFEDPAWKTRDQGTLIATIWKFGLEDHVLLDKKWNLIADFYNPFLKWAEPAKVQVASGEVIEPAFIHVYHHFQDEDWDFWVKLMERLS